MAKNEINELNKAGDPGSTPDTAEGDRETVEQSLREHEQKQDANSGQKRQNNSAGNKDE